MRAARVVFGAGKLDTLRDEAAHLGAKRALVLSTPEQADLAQKAAAILGDRAVGAFDKVAMHVPINIAIEGREVANRLNADCLVAMGGGSTTGLAKAIALETGLPILAIPTTYAGSEMTAVYGITDGGVKTTGTDWRVLSKTVIYDPGLTLTLPVALSVVSGLNAIAHSAEGLYAQNGNPVISLMAEEGIRAMVAGLRKLVESPMDRPARCDCLYGAWLCGMVLGSVGMALHHKLCHTLGGSFDLPHAQTHAVVLPHAIAYNAVAAPDAAARICRALGTENGNAGGALFDLAQSLGAPVSLKQIGMREAELDRATDIALQKPYWNPRVIDRAAIHALLGAAFDGSRPDE
ncbi:maleylacetate reductase (plasmid) [Paraburkholderia sp. PREW-6R]|uniref:maleylacetate reductase n=1 Tax=Paraburkholderia sp. PREW-6R TaxID=3141544 RepID=UPI0031F481C5